MRKLFIAAAGVALVTLPGSGMAQTAPAAPAASNLKGPPNVSGYGKGDTPSSPDIKPETPSATKLKGPPNANGYQKQ